MNGNWFHWSELRNGNQPRRLRAHRGATSWTSSTRRARRTSPGSGRRTAPGRPHRSRSPGLSRRPATSIGSASPDYNWGTNPAKPGNVWQDFDQVFRATYDACRRWRPASRSSSRRRRRASSAARRRPGSPIPEREAANRLSGDRGRSVVQLEPCRGQRSHGLGDRELAGRDLGVRLGHRVRLTHDQCVRRVAQAPPGGPPRFGTDPPIGSQPGPGATPEPQPVPALCRRPRHRLREGSRRLVHRRDGWWSAGPVVYASSSRAARPAAAPDGFCWCRREAGGCSRAGRSASLPALA